MINKKAFEYAKELADEKGISVEDVYEIIKAGLVKSYKKEYGDESCEVIIDPVKTEILCYSVKKVVSELSTEEVENQAEPKIAEITLEDAQKIKKSYKVGDIIKQVVDIKDFSRTAVGASKNMLTQGSKQKQRAQAFEHFKDMEGEMITATVSNVTDKYVVLNLGFGATTTLSNREILATDNFSIGDTLRVYIKKVEQSTKDPKITVSRIDKELVKRLMENYIPEIKDGTIEIKGIARDPGDRTKIALYSNDANVDAIGSCVGEAGSRIKQIVDALNGEKVDLYKWSENPEELITNSLQPASVTKVISIDEKSKSSVVAVPDDHLSLAIGKQGQNVRLAVQSCGWKIDILPVSKAYEEGKLI